MKLCSCVDDKSDIRKNLNKLEEYISRHIAKEKDKKISEHVNDVKLLGKFSQLKLWKLKQRLCPKPKDPPMAKKDLLGNLVTAPNELKELYAKTYEYRLRHRSMKEDLMDVYSLKTEL